MAISDQPDEVEMIDSEAETYDSDDSDEDTTFDVLEETRSRFSDLSVKKKTKPRIDEEIQEMDGDDEDDSGADVIESSVPELDEKDQKSFEIVQEIIEGGQVEKLKVEQCKVYLRKHGLRLTGKKDTLIDRIKEHFSIMNGRGEQKYPASSFVMNCKGDACTGDVVIFEQNVYEMFNIASRSANGPPCGTRVVAGRIVKDSYGAAKQQHTFTIEVLWSIGVKPLPPLHPLLIKGRNLYRLKTMRQRWEDEGERQKILMEKHNRGLVARSNREARSQEKEMRKTLRESRISGVKVQNGKQQTKRKTSPSQPIRSGIPSTQVSEHQNVQNPCQPQNQPLEQPKIIGAQIPQKKLCPIPNKNYLVPTVPFPGILGSQLLTSMNNLHQHVNFMGKSYQKENINFNMLQNVGRAMDQQTVNNNIPLSPVKSYEQNMCINSTRAQFLKHRHEETLNINYFQNPSRRHNFNEGNKYHVTRVQLHGQGVHPPQGHFQIHGQFHEHKVPCRYYAQAIKAVEVGVAGIIVSNHGARQLDYTPATINALEEVVLPVQGCIPVLFDGGVRRGTDIFKALVLGAKAVMVGRPVVYGLAAKGEYGVRRVIEMLKDELELTMALAGCCTLDDITRSHVRREHENVRCKL